MLKIKDNIKLEELEKYGFIRNTYYDDEINDYVNIYMHTHIQIRGDKLVIIEHIFPFEKPYSITVDIIYDLIQDGLVEKVEG